MKFNHNELEALGFVARRHPEHEATFSVRAETTEGDVGYLGVYVRGDSYGTGYVVSPRGRVWRGALAENGPKGELVRDVSEAVR